MLQAVFELVAIEVGVVRVIVGLSWLGENNGRKHDLIKRI